MYCKVSEWVENTYKVKNSFSNTARIVHLTSKMALKTAHRDVQTAHKTVDTAQS